MWGLLRQNIKYELNYWNNRFPINKILITITTAISSLILGLSNTLEFYNQENLHFFKLHKILREEGVERLSKDAEEKKQYLLWISAIIILSPFISSWLSNLYETSRDKNRIYALSTNILHPLLQKQVNDLYQILQQQFLLSDEIRIYIMIPQKISLFNWKLEISYHTDNMREIESKALLKLNEWGPGYIFNRATKYRNRPTYLPIYDPNTINTNFKNFKDLSDSNRIINSDLESIKGILAIPLFNNDEFLSGIIVIDTKKENDLALLENKIDLHNHIFIWSEINKEVISLICQQKNDI